LGSVRDWGRNARAAAAGARAGHEHRRAPAHLCRHHGQRGTGLCDAGGPVVPLPHPVRSRTASLDGE